MDTPKIERIIADLRPFVTEDIWLGTMNHLNQIKAGDGKTLTGEVAIIETGQTPETLSVIHDTFKDDPLIKWKTDALRAIGEFLAPKNFKELKN